jgi:hypothetical protein
LCSGSAPCLELAIRRRGFDRAWRRAASQAALADVRRAFETTSNDMRDWEAVDALMAPTAKG